MTVAIRIYIYIAIEEEEVRVQARSRGVELDSHEKASPEEIKRREVSWILTKKLAQKRSRGGRWCWARKRVGLLLIQLFPNGFSKQKGVNTQGS